MLIFTVNSNFLVIAGFVESYITRHTHIPDAIRLMVILLSAAFVVFYYIIYPRTLFNKSTNKDL